jgi:hypothetical protein
LADKLDTNGGRAWEMVDLLASSGLAATAIGSGSRSSDQTSPTERAALDGAPHDPTNGDQWRTNMWAEVDERMDLELRLLWRAGLTVEATIDRALAHGPTADPLPPGTGECCCGTLCAPGHRTPTFCAPRQNGPSDRLKSGLAPNCYRRFLRWQESNPGGTVADWKHSVRRAREIRDEHAARLAAGRAGVR